jgi:hypothetical protein
MLERLGASIPLVFSNRVILRWAVVYLCMYRLSEAFQLFAVIDSSAFAQAPAPTSDPVSGKSGVSGSGQAAVRRGADLQYASIRSSGVHIVKWSGQTSPRLADIIEVSLNGELLGQLVVFKRSQSHVACRYIGKPVDEQNLKQYTLKYIGRAQKSSESSIFANEIESPLEFVPQVAFFSGLNFGKNEILDITTLSPLDQDQSGLSLGVVLSAPPLDGFRWMNFLYLTGETRLYSKSRSRIVVGAEEQTAFRVEDEIEYLRFTLALRVPFPLRLLSSLELYSALESESHRIRLESTLLQDTDSARADLETTYLVSILN